MKKILTTLLVLAPLVGQTQAAVVNSGFDITKPGTSYTVGGTLDAGAFVQGVGDGRTVAGSAIANWDDTTSGAIADIQGWTNATGTPDVVPNGVGGSTGLNVFAAWGLSRAEAATTDTILAGATYTITAQIDGAAGGPMDGPLAFSLWAGGIELTGGSAIPAFVATPGTFQTITRTYTNVVLPGGASDGDALTILVGVDDSNTLGNRMIWDDVELTVVPEPSTTALLGLGGLALILRRRK